MIETLTNVLKNTLGKIGYVIHRKSVITKLRGGEDFVAVYDKCSSHTYMREGRSLGLYKAVEYLAANHIEGDVVECGVWRGGQCMVAASALLKSEGAKRTLWLYDTFAGMSEPTELDFKIRTGELATARWPKSQQGTNDQWLNASVEEVRKNMQSTGYPEDKIVYVKGKVEDTIPANMPQKIALLRLDTDWYESTAHELKHLFPLLAKGGILIIDDYYYWAGSQKAVDEYFNNRADMVFFDVDETKFGLKLCQ